MNSNNQSQNAQLIKNDEEEIPQVIQHAVGVVVIGMVVAGIASLFKKKPKPSRQSPQNYTNES